MFKNVFSEIHTVYEIMSKIMMKTQRTHVTSQHGAHELHAGKARLHARIRPRARMHVHTDQ
jgi:hypothetical protein